MADVPYYLQGSQTGGVLQNLQPAQNGPYTPGQGMAPYANSLPSVAPMGLEAFRNANLGKFKTSADLMSAYNALGATSTFASAPQTAGNAPPVAPPASGGITATPGGWMSPEELRAQTNSLQTHLGTSGSGGGGGGGGMSMPSGAGANNGLNLSGAGGNFPTGSTPDSLQQSSTPTSPTIGYQDPGGVNNTSTVGYQGAGQGGSQGQQGVLQMQQANPQSAIQQYQNTPGYQMLNDPNAYQQSPGYQYAMDQAMGQVQNGASARGMLESGSVLRDMQKTASGLAQQDYGNWWNRQNQLYGDYQNRLQGLAGGPTGSADAMTTGANLAQGNLQTGSNLGSLFGNQGSAGMSGIINTGAAQAGNMINAGQQQAQVQSANQATQLAGATLGAQQNQNRGLF